jgi:hypothetical protein
MVIFFIGFSNGRGYEIDFVNVRCGLVMKHKPAIYLCNRKNRVALVMVTGTWLFPPMMAGVRLTGVQTALGEALI